MSRALDPIVILRDELANERLKIIADGKLISNLNNVITNVTMRNEFLQSEVNRLQEHVDGVNLEGGMTMKLLKMKLRTLQEKYEEAQLAPAVVSTIGPVEDEGPEITREPFISIPSLDYATLFSEVGFGEALFVIYTQICDSSAKTLVARYVHDGRVTNAFYLHIFQAIDTLDSVWFWTKFAAPRGLGEAEYVIWKLHALDVVTPFLLLTVHNDAWIYTLHKSHITREQRGQLYKRLKQGVTRFTNIVEAKCAAFDAKYADPSYAEVRKRIKVPTGTLPTTLTLKNVDRRRYYDQPECYGGDAGEAKRRRLHSRKDEAFTRSEFLFDVHPETIGQFY